MALYPIMDKIRTNKSGAAGNKQFHKFI